MVQSEIAVGNLLLPDVVNRIFGIIYCLVLRRLPNKNPLTRIRDIVWCLKLPLLVGEDDDFALAPFMVFFMNGDSGIRVSKFNPDD
jgi:hypothetical protein